MDENKLVKFILKVMNVEDQVNQHVKEYKALAAQTEPEPNSGRTTAILMAILCLGAAFLLNPNIFTGALSSLDSLYGSEAPTQPSPLPAPTPTPELPEVYYQ